MESPNAWKQIDSHTVLYGVFGDPVRHSKSPIMLNRAFQTTEINGVYAAFHIRPGELEEAVKGIRALGFRGVNVTIPHKEEVMKYLDEIDEGARAAGAVNTIVNDGGKLIGYNTDGIGYVRSLKEETGVDLRGKRIVILGARGAARGVGTALAAERPAAIHIVNRTSEKAAELASIIGKTCDCTGLGWDLIQDALDDADIIINTTPIGMHPDVDAVPVDPSRFKSGAIVSDIVYNPLITNFLREAEARGMRIHGGLGMFIYQGAYAFEYWTGKDAPVAAMRLAVEEEFAAVAANNDSRR